MATISASPASTTSRPLALRMRPDLKMRRHFYLNQPCWVIKEPVGLKYFRLHEEEFDVLNLVDGRRSLDDIKEEFDRKHAPQTISHRDLQQFIGSAHRSGLVISTATGQGEQLWQRRRKIRRKQLMSKLMSIFWVRFRGIDPTWILKILYPWTAWFFSRPAVIAAMLLAVSALALVIVQFDVFVSRLPSFHQFFAAGNWLLLALTLACVKVLHELGHGLTCRRMGGECHEIGFMLLVFTPALYCNVSDNWMEPNKWKRAAVGAAGMYVEIVMASIATFLWWFSEPGVLNHVCLNVMFICSVSTILFNGNPLLRFDGYYILADAVEIPNLRQKSTQVIRRRLLKTCMEIDLPDDSYTPKRRRVFMAIYGVAATIYRWLVVLGIILFLHAVLEPHGFQIVGRMLAVAGVAGLIVVPIWQMIKFFRVPGRMHEVKKRRLFITLGIVAGVVVLILCLPFPHHVTCSFTVEPQDAVTVYVVVPGTVEQVSVEAGQQVAKGDPIAQLIDPGLQRSVIQLRRQRDELEERIDSLTQIRFRDSTAVLDMATLQKQLDSVRQQLVEKEQHLSFLRLTAPSSGTVIPAGFHPNRQSDGQLPTWTGWPLDEKNVGAFLEEGLSLCRIGNPSKLEAVALVDQSDIDFVAVGQQVELQLESRPDATMIGKIVEMSPREIVRTPTSLMKQAGGDVETEPDGEGTQRPTSATYQARIQLETPAQLQINLRGRAKIRIGSRSLGSRFGRYLARTFHFDL